MLPWIVAGCALALSPLAVICVRLYIAKRRLTKRFKPIVDIDAELANVQRGLADLQRRREELGSEYSVGLANLEKLKAEIQRREGVVEVADFGLYRPTFTFEHSDLYRQAIESIRDEQRQMIRAGSAVKCPVEWQVGGNAREGAKMVKRYEKLILRAFNGDCDAAVSSVNWRNFASMDGRIRKSFEVLNDLGASMHVSLQSPYRDSKLKELKLAFEEAEKKQAEKEEQRRIREQMREEERVQRELNAARESAEKDEARAEKFLADARRQVAMASDAQHAIMAARVAELERQLADAQARKERAIARAQMTRQGHVYVISNIGSFGEGVIKIGMTRRLDPLERVFELGDASVPFPFDVHGMIFSEDAPSLETELHNQFWDNRLNHANDRKEFFRVNLQELAEFAKQRSLKLELTMVAEAKQFRQTQFLLAAAKAQKENGGVPQEVDAGRSFPRDPFQPTAN